MLTSLEARTASRGFKPLLTLVHENLEFALPATAIEELLEISDRGQLMPPKSTWFEPKLADVDEFLLKFSELVA